MFCYRYCRTYVLYYLDAPSSPEYVPRPDDEDDDEYYEEGDEEADEGELEDDGRMEGEEEGGDNEHQQW